MTQNGILQKSAAVSEAASSTDAVNQRGSVSREPQRGSLQCESLLQNKVLPATAFTLFF